MSIFHGNFLSSGYQTKLENYGNSRGVGDVDIFCNYAMSVSAYVHSKHLFDLRSVSHFSFFLFPFFLPFFLGGGGSHLN